MDASLQNLESDIQDLIEALRLVKGFAVYFVVCNQVQHSLQIMEQVEQEFPNGYIVRIPLTEPCTHFTQYVRSRVEALERTPHTLFFYGMENWIANDKAERTDLILELNMTRNSMSLDLPFSLVFWVPEYLYSAMRVGAPDFCSIASDILFFQSKAPNPSTTEQLTAGDYTGLLGLTPSERNQRIQDLTQLLADYRALSDPQRDYLSEARILNTLGELYFAQGEYATAEPYYKEALTLRERFLKEGHPDITESLSNIAYLYTHQKRYEEAESLTKWVLDLIEDSLPKGYSYSAMSFNDLAYLYIRQRRYEEAEPLLKQALGIWQKSLPKRHPYIALSLYNLANLYYEQGRYEKAEPLYKQALEIWQNSLPKGHPYITMCFNNLATLYEAQGRIAEAESLRRKSRENEA